MRFIISKECNAGDGFKMEGYKPLGESAVKSIQDADIPAAPGNEKNYFTFIKYITPKYIITS